MSCKTSPIRRHSTIPSSLRVVAADAVTMTGKDEEVSQNTGENSPNAMESASMSPVSDVLEMQSLCGQIADRIADGSSEKDRITAIAKQLGFGWNRALEFLRAKARRVDSWEKDHARAELAKLRDAERRQRELEHLEWVEEQIARHRTSGEELRGPMVDGLQHFLRLARGDAGAVALQPTQEGGRPASRTE